MARFFKKRDLIHGRSPEAFVFLGNQKIEQALIRVIDFSRDACDVLERLHVRDIPPHPGNGAIRWVSVYGLHDTAMIRELGERYAIHPLVLEDIVNTGQRPKIEEYDDYVFLVVKIVRFTEEEGASINSDQLSIVVGENWLLTFQEKPTDMFAALRDRLRKPNHRLREQNIGHLVYAILDTVVDQYMATIETLGGHVEDLEEPVLTDPTPEILDRVTTFKRETAFLRKTIRPVYELVMQLGRLETELIGAEMQPFITDLQDHIIHTQEALETYREMLSDQLNIYHTSISNRMNEVMKTLTIFAAIFIPLTFIAGIYGTNFDYLPELHFRYAYFIFWVVIIVIALAMLRYFKKKGWL